MTVGDALVVLAVFLGLVASLAAIYMFVFDVNLIEMWQTQRRKKREKHLPLYERLARADERAAEKHLDRGNTDLARLRYRDATRIRSEATEAMMRGQEPPI